MSAAGSIAATALGVLSVIGILAVLIRLSYQAGYSEGWHRGFGEGRGK